MIDLLVLAVAALAARSGWRIGGVVVALHVAGLVAGLLTGLWGARLLSSSLSPVTHVLLGVVCALGGTVLGAAIGRRAGIAIAAGINRAHFGVLDRVLGAITRGGVALCACWVIGALVIALGPAGWAGPVRSSAVLGGHDGTSPIVDRMLDGVSGALRSEAPADVAALVPERDAQQPSDQTVRAVDHTVAGSVFLISSNGCSGSVVGTGFVAASGLVVTNAHVVRGATTVSVQTPDGKLHATPVVVDRRADLAVLRVSGLVASSLTLAHGDAPNGTRAVVVGYPGGGPRTAVGAAIVQRVPIPDPGFSDGIRLHVAYLLHAVIRHGNSGSPLLNTSGQVIGVVNALAGDDGAQGYAIALDELLPDLADAQSAQSPASTGACT